MGTYMGCDHVEVMLRNHEYYPSKEAVLSQIRENNNMISHYKQKLFAMVCGNIKDLFNCKDVEGNECNPIDVAKCEFDKIFGTEGDWEGGIEDLIIHNVDLQYIANNWDKRWSEFDGYGLNKEEDNNES